MGKKLDWLVFFGVLLMVVLLFSHLAFKVHQSAVSASEFHFVEAEK